MSVIPPKAAMNADAFVGSVSLRNPLRRIVRQELEQLFYRPRNVGTAVIPLSVKQVGLAKHFDRSHFVNIQGQA
jgi:hypothetical protein